MAIEKEQLSHLLRSAFPDANFKLIDLLDSGDHYELKIYDKSFEGRKLIEQHRMVKAALSDVLKKDLHALTIKIEKNI